MNRTLFPLVLAIFVSPPLSGPPVTTAPTPGSSVPTSDNVKSVCPNDGVAVFIDTEDPSRSWVEVSAMTCLDSGWLEQVACAPATREHESLVVVKAKPSHIHAALLMAGFESGTPGRWKYENDTFDIIKPTGEKLDVLVRYTDSQGKVNEHEIGKWIREAMNKPGEEPKPFPREPFIFGGSRFETDPAPPPPPGGAAANDQSGGTRPGARPDAATQPASRPRGEQYIADLSGSVIGLVTFGDEMIGFSVVRSDQEAVQEPTWEANPESLPEVGTPVTLIIKKWK